MRALHRAERAESFLFHFLSDGHAFRGELRMTEAVHIDCITNPFPLHRYLKCDDFFPALRHAMSMQRYLSSVARSRTAEVTYAEVMALRARAPRWRELRC